jgi:hypothetical protein
MRADLVNRGIDSGQDEFMILMATVAHLHQIGQLFSERFLELFKGGKCPGISCFKP